MLFTIIYNSVCTVLNISISIMKVLRLLTPYRLEIILNTFTLIITRIDYIIVGRTYTISDSEHCNFTILNM